MSVSDNFLSASIWARDVKNVGTPHVPWERLNLLCCVVSCLLTRADNLSLPRCSTCNGCGQLECSVCHTRGQLKCYIKLTVTWKTTKADHIVERTALPDHLIRNAQGKIAFQDQQPRVNKTCRHYAKGLASYPGSSPCLPSHSAAGQWLGTSAMKQSSQLITWPVT